MWESKLGHLTSSFDEDAEKRARVGLESGQAHFISCNKCAVTQLTRARPRARPTRRGLIT